MSFLEIYRIWQQIVVGNGYSDNDFSVKVATDNKIAVIFHNRPTDAGDKQGFLIDTAKGKIKAVVIRTPDRTQDAANQAIRQVFGSTAKELPGIRRPSFPQE